MAQWETREPIYREYIGFTFNGVHSSQLNLYRVSDGSRYNEDMSAAFQDKTVQAPGRDGTFYFGTNYTSRTFNIQLAFDSMTEDDMIEFRRIFAAKEEGYLIFDESAYKKYKVKIQSPPQLKYIVFDDLEDRNSNKSSLIHNHDLGKEGATNSPIDTGRVYKGEGTIQFVAYYPFAIDNGRYIQNYVESINNNANLIQYPYLDGVRTRKNRITFIVNTGSTTTNDIGKIVIAGTSNWNGKITYYNINNCLTLKPNTLNSGATNIRLESSYADVYYLDANIEDSNLNDDGSGSGYGRVALDMKQIGGKGKILYPVSGETELRDLPSSGRGTVSTRGSRGAKFYIVGDSVDVKVFIKVKNVINQNPIEHRINRVGPEIKRYSTQAGTTVVADYTSPLLAGRPDFNKYKPWANGVKTWREGGHMKDTQLGTYDTTTNALSSPFNPPYDCCTFSTNSVIYPTTDPRYGKTFFRVCNAGEVDSDVMLYFNTGANEPKSLSLYARTLIEGDSYSVDEENDNEITTITTPSEKFDQVATLTFNDFSNLGSVSSPEIIRYNSHTNLLEGVYRDGGVDIPTGNIYNRHIISGSFFKIPAYSSDVEYYIIAESKNTTPTTACMIDDIEYHHVYY